MTDTDTETAANRRQSYPARWAAFDRPKRIEIAGSDADADALDAWLAAVADESGSEMERIERVALAYQRLASIRTRIATTEAHLERLRVERRRLFAFLLLAGESQAKVGTRANVSAMVVSYETGIATKKR